MKPVSRLGAVIGSVVIALALANNAASGPEKGRGNNKSDSTSLELTDEQRALLEQARLNSSVTGSPATKNDNSAAAARLRQQMDRHLDRVGRQTKNQPMKTHKNGMLSQVVPVDFLNYSVARRNSDGSISVHHAGSLDEAESILAAEKHDSGRAKE